jgi:hypothetical protein
MRNTTQAVIGATLGLVLFGAPVSADDSPKLVGLWKLVSFYTEDVHTKVRANVYGDHPKGYMAITADGRFHAYALSDWPKPAESVWEDVAQSFSLQAGAHRAIHYSGKYRGDRDKLIVHVDRALHEGWVGTDPFDISWTEGRTATEEMRSFRLTGGGPEGPTLNIETPAIPNPNGAGNTIIGRVTWEQTSDW